MVLTGIIIFIILASCGAVVKYGKQHWLIAGYNTMPPEKKKNVDITGLANFMANSFFGIGAFALVGSLVTSRWCPNLFPYLLILCSAGTVLMLPVAQKFDHNKRSGREKKVLLAVLAFAGIVLITIVCLMIYSHRSPVVEIKPEGIVISGIYGAAISREEITGIDLKNEIPGVLSKNNGFNCGDVRKGHFTLKEMGRGRLYLESGQGPFVYIFTKESYLIINYKDPVCTKALYQTLLDGFPM
ncbi:MAG: DUF3784 domain-containing protein [Firmicutes bacterium]|nr:DUF3784 domain-containing protein [Bacillota bacterium]